MSIHKTAIVSKEAELDSSCFIGPNVIVEPDVKIAGGVEIKANAYICSGTEIGAGTVIHMGAIIGNEPQDYSYKGEKTFIVQDVKENVIIRDAGLIVITDVDKCRYQIRDFRNLPTKARMELERTLL